ncbi:MAG: hypothetical protein QME96_14415 [Myxococcota bacterium]|nr:hypothetical protein [Myxococcota bacterium]
MKTIKQMPPQKTPGHAAGASERHGTPGEDRDVTAIFLSPLKPKVARGAPIELTIVRRTGTSHSDAGEEWVAAEIWTHNRIYLLNGRMRCIAVVARTTGRREPQNAFIGSWLNGGQRRSPERVELSQPFPVPGMRAVFRHGDGPGGRKRFGETSEVDRVVVRLGITVLNTDDVAESHHDLTARFFMPTK